MVAGDLHWDRIEAGNYETAYWCNDYLYKVINENADYGPPGSWVPYYKWHKDSKKKWKRMRGVYDYDTLKSAKEACRQHNIRPRAKYKFIRRVNKLDASSSWRLRDHLGKLLFRQVNDEGKISRYSSEKVLDPDSFSAEVSYIGDKYVKDE